MRRRPLGIILVVLMTVGGISLLSWLYSMRMKNVFFSTLAGVVTYTIVLWLVSVARHRKYHDRPDSHEKIVHAIQEVARGNFNVLIESDPRQPHNEMADAFNKMAHDLGDLETMRQDFISNVSHEIQSPLTSIGGFAALLKNDALPAEERRRYVEIIEAESKRLSSLSDNLLKLSALDSEKKSLHAQPFRLDKQLQQVALTLEPQWSAKCINLEADLMRYEYNGDADLLNQVWVNLIYNAVKFTPEGGAIHIGLTVNAKSLIVTIADNGAGIDESDKPHIFERFYKADKARDRSLGGNGLGLSIVKKIVDMHGGSVSVDSEAGKGTRFTVKLPLYIFPPLSQIPR